MKFLALLKDHQNTPDKVAQMKWAEERGGHDDGVWHLPKGVKILESGLLFGGKYDLAIFYEAPDVETAYSFLSEIWPYSTVERYLTTPCSWCENTKELQ